MIAHIIALLLSTLAPALPATEHASPAPADTACRPIDPSYQIQCTDPKKETP